MPVNYTKCRRTICRFAFSFLLSFPTSLLHHAHFKLKKTLQIHCMLSVCAKSGRVTKTPCLLTKCDNFYHLVGRHFFPFLFKFYFSFSYWFGSYKSYLSCYPFKGGKIVIVNHLCIFIGVVRGQRGKLPLTDRFSLGKVIFRRKWVFWQNMGFCPSWKLTLNFFFCYPLSPIPSGQESAPTTPLHEGTNKTSL